MDGMHYGLVLALLGLCISCHGFATRAPLARPRNMPGGLRKSDSSSISCSRSCIHYHAHPVATTMTFRDSLRLGMVSPESENQEDEQDPDLKLALGQVQPFLKIAVLFSKRMRWLGTV